MSTDFIFDELTDSDVYRYAEQAYVFNRSKDYIEKEKIVLNSFSDESLGDSEEKLDVAVKYKDKGWCLLNIDDKIESYNEIPLGYILNGVEYDKVLIILRRMSNFVFDKSDGSSNSYIYSIVRDEYSDIVNHPDLSGLLALNRVYLDKSFDELSQEIIENFNDIDSGIIIDAIKKIVGE